MNWAVFLPSFNKENILQYNYSIKSSLLQHSEVAWMKESFLSFQRTDNSLRIVFKNQRVSLKHCTGFIIPLNLLKITRLKMQMIF